jgi:hypothetical protein
MPYEWGVEYDEDSDGWEGNLFDLVRADRWDAALAYLQAHTFNITAYYVINGAIIGGKVPVEFLAALLDAVPPKQQHVALMSTGSRGNAAVSTAVHHAVDWCVSPAVLQLLINRCPESLLIRVNDELNSLQLAKAVAARPSDNPRNPNETANAAANLQLLERICEFYPIRLQQITLHLAILHQQNTPTMVSSGTRPLLNFLIGIRMREPGIIRIVCSYVGPNQQSYDNQWQHSELMEKIASSEALQQANATLADTNAVQQQAIAAQQQTIAALTAALVATLPVAIPERADSTNKRPRK